MFRHRLTLLLTTCLPLLATGCGTARTYFRPAESVLTESPTGSVAAQYELRGGAGSVKSGEVRVWCNSVVEEENPDDDGSTSFVDLGMEIENDSDGELELVLDEITLRTIETRKGPIAELRPDYPRDSVRVAPFTVANVDISFMLPEDIRPRDVRSFRLRWVVTGQDNVRYSQFTSFVPGRRRPYARRSGWWPFGFWGAYWLTFGVHHSIHGLHRWH